jgi:hypothetical protein
MGGIAGGIYHVADGFEVVLGVAGLEGGAFDVPGFGVVMNDDAAGVGRAAVLLALGVYLIRRDAHEPEKGAGGPMGTDAVFQHSGVAEQPGNDRI